MHLEQILIYENKKQLQNAGVKITKKASSWQGRNTTHPSGSGGIGHWRGAGPLPDTFLAPVGANKTSWLGHLSHHLCPLNLAFRRGQQWCWAPAVPGRCCLLPGTEWLDGFSSRMQAHPTLPGTLSLTFRGTACSCKKNRTVAEGTACFCSAGEHRKCVHWEHGRREETATCLPNPHHTLEYGFPTIKEIAPNTIIQLYYFIK